MHPPLTPHKHSECIEYIMNLNNCHMNNPIKKYFGVCNVFKEELNKCFALEFEQIRKKNAEKAKENRLRTEKLWEEFKE